MNLLLFLRLSTREKQAYAAVMFKEFCKKYDIENHLIDDLIAHLFSILVSENLPEWEQEGKVLEFSGREDDFDAMDWSTAIDDCLKEDLFEIIRCVVEVGLIDMYGADTGLPLTFLKETKSILKKHDIDLPKNYFHLHGRSWGKAYSKPAYTELKKRYLIK